MGKFASSLEAMSYIDQKVSPTSNIRQAIAIAVKKLFCEDGLTRIDFEQDSSEYLVARFHFHQKKNIESLRLADCRYCILRLVWGHSRVFGDVWHHSIVVSPHDDPYGSNKDTLWVLPKPV